MTPVDKCSDTTEGLSLTAGDAFRSRSVPKVGLIVNDGKPLAVETAKLIQDRLETGGHSVVRASSSGGMVGFANPDQHLRMLGYNACVPEGFDPSMALAIVLSDDFAISHAADEDAAENVVGMLKTRPTQMSRMMEDLIGFTWQAEVGSDEPPHVAALLTDSQHGFLVIWGGIDSVNKIVPDYGYSATSSAALRNLAAESAGHVVAADFALDAEQRALLRFVEPDTTDEDDLRSQLVYLHQRILAELVEADSATIDDSLALYSDALKLTHDPATTWKIVLTALFQDFRVAYH